MYIWPNSLLYIQGEVVQFSKSIMLRRSAVGDHVSLVSLRPIRWKFKRGHIVISGREKGVEASWLREPHLAVFWALLVGKKREMQKGSITIYQKTKQTRNREEKCVDDCCAALCRHLASAIKLTTWLQTELTKTLTAFEIYF